MQEYLKLDRLRKEYNRKIAVSDLSLSVPKGSIYGIIGPNGAGKTTTIRMIMNIIAPDSGEVLIDGKKPDKTFLNRVGYLPEERGLYNKMTLEEAIYFFAELKGMKRSAASAKIDPWLERMNLLEYKKSKVEELSKGMTQKLQFITTMLHEPDLIILDELFSGLDPINIEIIKEIVLEQKRNGKTILFSTHVMEQAEKLCDYICLINKGHKVLDGKLAEVKRNFGSNTIQVDMEGDGSFIKNLPGAESFNEFNNYIEIKISDDSNPQELLRTISEKVNIRRFEIIEPSLYNIFIEVAKVDPEELEKIEAEAKTVEGGHV